jgi:mono/diheme cytochrome c family protein
MAFRSLLALVGSLLSCSTLAAQQTSAPALSAFQRAKAEALLEHKLPCLGCHTIGTRGGVIGPDLSNVGLRLDRARIRAQIEDPRALIPTGLMPRIALPASSRDLVVAYLAEQRATPIARAAAQSAQPVAAATDAQALYARHCAACHGARGAGDGYNAARLDRPPTKHADARVMSVRTDDRLYDAIYAGGAIMGGSARMPGFGQTLTPAQIRLLVAHIRELCRCRQPAWADVTR